MIAGGPISLLLLVRWPMDISIMLKASWHANPLVVLQFVGVKGGAFFRNSSANFTQTDTRQISKLHPFTLNYNLVAFKTLLTVYYCSSYYFFFLLCPFRDWLLTLLTQIHWRTWGAHVYFIKGSLLIVVVRLRCWDRWRWSNKRMIVTW